MTFLTGCSDSGSGGSSGFGLPPAGGDPITAPMLDGALLELEKADPACGWGFRGSDFWIERKEAAPLPGEIVELLLGKQMVTSWLRGKWALEGDGFLLKFSGVSGPGGVTGAGVTVPVTVNGPTNVSLGSTSYTVRKDGALQPPRFELGVPVAFRDRESGLWGFKDAVSGEVLVPAGYERAWDFSQKGIACVWDGEPGFVNTRGEYLLQPFWVGDGPDPFVEDRARFVDESNRMGFFNESGEIRIPARWGFVGPFEDGIALVSDKGEWKGEKELRRYTGGVWGAIDQTGEMIVQVRYHFLERGPGNTFRVAPEGPWFRPGGIASLNRE